MAEFPLTFFSFHVFFFFFFSLRVIFFLLLLKGKILNAFSECE